MEPERNEKQSSIQFRYQKILAGTSSEKKHSVSETNLAVKTGETQEPGDSFESPTPEKPDWGSKTLAIASITRKQLAGDFDNEELSEEASYVQSALLKDKSVELPDKYKILANLFNRMETSFKLLGLRKMLPTFQNISKQVEVLAKRKFLHGHLAQIKYLFPEAIQIEKILVHDNESLMMIPDLKITLLKEVVEHVPLSYKSVSVALCEAFHARLLNFFITHPEGTNIPEGVLPEPFNHRNHTLPLKLLPEQSILELKLQTSKELGLLSSASHLASSFHRQFSEKVIIPQAHRTQLLATQASLDSSSCNDQTEENKSPQKLDGSSFSLSLKSLTQTVSNPSQSMVSQNYESTPLKGDSDYGAVLTDTPVLQTPKRPLPTPHEKLSSGDEKLIVETRVVTSARRSLIYSPSNTKGSVSDQVVETTSWSKIAKHYLDQNESAKRSLWEEETGGSSDACSSVVHGIAIGQFEDPKLNQIGDRKHHEMLACLPTFDAICFISRSTSCSAITKEELMHKILSINLEIEETREVEEHLSFLELVLPDWISKKAVSKGQFLYCIKQASDREAFRARLIEAVYFAHGITY